VSLEVWKDVLGYEGFYQVSDKGRVKSVDRRVVYSNGRVYNYREKTLKPAIDKDGYCVIGLCVKQKIKVKKVHRLVAECFIDNLENKPQVNHKDGIKCNNHVGNLEWCTCSENQRHCNDTGLRVAGKGDKATSNKLTEIDVGFIRLWIKLGHSQREIAKIFKVHFATISCIHVGKSWVELGETYEIQSTS
jgi:hypothetical protein